MSDEKPKAVSKYGKPIGRPRGRRDSDLKKTILDLARQYRIPSLLWGALQEAKKDMSKSEWFRSMVVVTELMVKCSPKELAISGNTNSTFQLIIKGIDSNQPPRYVEGEVVPIASPPVSLAGDPDYPRSTVRDPGDARNLRALPPPPDPPVAEKELDTRRQRIIQGGVKSDWNLSDGPNAIGVVDA